MTMKTFLLAILILVAAGGSHAQSDWHTYPERMMAELMSITTPTAAQKSDIIISANPFPSKSVVTFLGKKRTITGDTRKVIDLWVESMGLPAERKKMITDEYLFKENDREIWIPATAKILPFIDKELQPGDKVMLYYFFIGGYNSKTLYDNIKDKNKPVFAGKDQIEWIFVAEEFVKGKPNPGNGFITQPFTDAIDTKFKLTAGMKDVFLDTRLVKSKSTVTYTGQARPTNVDSKKLIDKWGETANMIDLSNLFEEEILFKLNGKDHWLPVRETVLERMRGELTKGDPITVNTILLGGVPKGEFVDWLFVVGEFAK